jgi:glycosyltransferase involved in cell wall biosynthesis
MKIGIEVQRLFRKKKFGIETSSLQLIKFLTEANRGNEYVIFAKNDEDRAALVTSDNVKVKIVGGRYFVDFEQVFLPITARNEKVDVLHCTGNTTPYFCSVPIVQTLHDVIFMDDIPEDDTFYQRFGNHYRRKIVPLVTPRSKVVITVSQYEKQRIVDRLGITPDKVHVVYNGIDEKRFFKNNDPADHLRVRRKYALPETFILFLGNASCRKNSCRVIESYMRYAAKTDNPMPLVTPGLTETFITEKLKELKFPFDKQKFITPGYIDEGDLQVVYGLSQFFIFPSLSEGFGMPVVEAMACGTPVITSNVSALPEIAGNAAVLVDPLNTSQLTEAIISLAGNEQLRSNKIMDGLQNVKRFSWARSAEKVLRLYEAVFENSKNASREPTFAQKHIYATRE